MGVKGMIASVVAVVTLLVVGVVCLNSWTTIKSGHVGVTSMMGRVLPGTLSEGFNLVNPMWDIKEFDARQKTIAFSMGVPSADQLVTTFKVSVQYRLLKDKAPSMLQDTGTPQMVIDIHMIPKMRSLMREIGKSVPTAEEFFNQSTQQRIQTELLTGLSPLSEKGVLIEELLIREVTLPGVITKAVMAKKQAAQDAVKEVELRKKFEVAEQRKAIAAEADKKALLVRANAKLDASRIEAEAVIIKVGAAAEAILLQATAEAKAKKKQIAVVGLKGYLQLEALKTLEIFQNGNHMIIMDSENTSPLPFLNLNRIQ